MKFWPQWTRRVVTEGTGRDPLGLSRVSDLLTDYLLPGIITTTNRARYYSFYTWAISDVAATRATAGRHFSFEVEFQRQEAAFAMVSQLGTKTDLTIVGIDKLKGKLAEAEADDTADTPIVGSESGITSTNTTAHWNSFCRSPHAITWTRF